MSVRRVVRHGPESVCRQVVDARWGHLAFLDKPGTGGDVQGTGYERGFPSRSQETRLLPGEVLTSPYMKKKLTVFPPVPCFPILKIYLHGSPHADDST